MKKRNGIVLISLIITIVVVIIIANVAVKLSTGDEGIITKSEKGTQAYKKEMAKEDIVLAWDAITIEYEGDTLLEEKDKSAYFTQENMSKNVKNNGIILDYKYGDDFTTLKYATYSDGNIYDMMIDNSGVFVTNITLYDKATSKYLVDNVEIGDYVDIGINYNNADMSLFNSKYVNENYGETGPTGWRVLNKNRFGVTGEVVLISAGCPLKLENNSSNLENLLNFSQCDFISTETPVHEVTIDEIFDCYKTLMNEEKEFDDFLNKDNLLTSSLIKKNNKYNKKAFDLLANGFDYHILDLYNDNNFCKILANGNTKTIKETKQNNNLYLIRPVVTLKYNLEIDENNAGDGKTPVSAYTINNIYIPFLNIF